MARSLFPASNIPKGVYGGDGETFASENPILLGKTVSLQQIRKGSREKRYGGHSGARPPSAAGALPVGAGKEGRRVVLTQTFSGCQGGFVCPRGAGGRGQA